MAELSVYENATGPCAICGEESEGSPYWIGMPQSVWLKIRPYVSHLFKPNRVMKILFIPPHDKPLCGTTCVEKYYASKS